MFRLGEVVGYFILIGLQKHKWTLDETMSPLTDFTNLPKCLIIGVELQIVLNETESFKLILILLQDFNEILIVDI